MCRISGHMLYLDWILSGGPVYIVYNVQSAGHPLGRLKRHNVTILSTYPTHIWTEWPPGFNVLWHVTIMETDAALKRGLPVPIYRIGIKTITQAWLGERSEFCIWAMAKPEPSWAAISRAISKWLLAGAKLLDAGAAISQAVATLICNIFCCTLGTVSL